MTSPPKDSVYSRVVTLRSLRLCMFLGELNGLDVDAADVGNAYLMAYTKRETLHHCWTQIWGSPRLFAHHCQGSLWTSD
jgi:hypothetical protein